MNEKLFITPLYASLLSLMYVACSIYVITKRWKLSIAIGNGQNAEMEKAIRIHGNFQEYIPLSIILLLILELQNFYPPLYLHLLGVMLLLGRVLHLIGFSKTRGPSLGRFLGMVLTFLFLVLCSFLLIIKIL